VIVPTEFLPGGQVEAIDPPFTTLVSPLYTCCMATAVKSLHVGELVDVDGRRYEVVPDGAGDLTLEPTITPMAELDRRRGAKPASREDFDRLFGHLPTDGEG
jgi:hypothetical protein